MNEKSLGCGGRDVAAFKTRTYIWAVRISAGNGVTFPFHPMVQMRPRGQVKGGCEPVGTPWGRCAELFSPGSRTRMLCSVRGCRREKERVFIVLNTVLGALLTVSVLISQQIYN